MKHLNNSALYYSSTRSPYAFLFCNFFAELLAKGKENGLTVASFVESLPVDSYIEACRVFFTRDSNPILLNALH